MIFLLGIFAIYGKFTLQAPTLNLCKDLYIWMKRKKCGPLRNNTTVQVGFPLVCTNNPTFWNVASKLHNENDNETQLRQFFGFSRKPPTASINHHPKWINPKEEGTRKKEIQSHMWRHKLPHAATKNNPQRHHFETLLQIEAQTLLAKRLSRNI
jgi:hypothetical protein